MQRGGCAGFILGFDTVTVSSVTAVLEAPKIRAPLTRSWPSCGSTYLTVTNNGSTPTTQAAFAGPCLVGLNMRTNEPRPTGASIGYGCFNTLQASIGASLAVL